MRRHARGRTGPTRQQGEMNRYEAAYAGDLELLRLKGEVDRWMYEAVKLRLAPKTFFTPDFVVVKADGYLELHEVKGHWEEDARIKMKVAAEMYPMFKFIAVQLKLRAKKRGGGFEVIKTEEF